MTPCAQVSASVAAQKSVATPTVAAELAYECITSVPFNQTAALALVDGVVPYFKWQTTTAFLKDPPEEYAQKVQPAVDLWGELEKIRGKVIGGHYENEYEVRKHHYTYIVPNANHRQFGFELYLLTLNIHDGHFVYTPDVIGTVFNFARPVALVSVSADGKELPKAYVYADILAESFGNSTFTPSPISKINGEDPQAFLENWAQYGTLQDRDALYNNVFYVPASVSLGGSGAGIGTFAGSGRGRYIYPGATTELEFENGTSVTYDNYAKVMIPFTGITDGGSLYKTWFTGNQPPAATPAPSPSNITSSAVSSTAASATVASIPAPGYPPPVIREAHNLIGGYYLEDDYSDVAVLSVTSFLGNSAQEWQDTASKFLAAAKAAGKKKLVVDVSANGGGIILLGYDLYKLLFPNNNDRAAADRIRAFETTDVLGQKFSEIAEGLPRQVVTEEENATLFRLTNDVVTSPFNYQQDVSANETNFVSWEDKFGPILHEKGDNFSNLFRWNFSDILLPINSNGVYIHGYGPLSNYTQQPFAAEDVVVVTDGYCSSTCTIFSELMRQRAGIKYISLGGRPREGITQAIGGVKGTNNYPWTYLQFLAKYTVNDLASSAEEAARLNSTELGDYWSNVVFDRVAKGTALNVNFRDGIRDGDDTNTPLQFVYEPSDCRILYTKQMTVDVTATWKAVADSAWGGKSHCIAGDLGGVSTGSKLARRELTVHDKVLSRRMHQWRRDLKEQDYPLDVFTDLREAKLDGDGIMWP